VVSLWDSLYHTIDKALYLEAARWGDHRRDVRPQGTVYGGSTGSNRVFTVDDAYMTERNRLLSTYFPYRSEKVLNNILALVQIDDFEAPEDWVPLTAQMFHQWNSTGADAQVVNENPGAELNLNGSVGGGGVVAGFSSVGYNLFADVSQYDKLVIRGTGNRLRILANRLVDHGEYKQIVVSLNSSDPYWDDVMQAVVLPLDNLKTMPTNTGSPAKETFVHINALKVESGNTVNISGLWLVPSPVPSSVGRVSTPASNGLYYNLNGQVVTHPTKGVYIHNGKKVIIK
jgi:hypothetical protein